MRAPLRRSQLVHLMRPPLPRRHSRQYLPAMLRVLARQIGTIILALGVVLGGVVPAWAMPPHAAIQKMATMQVAVGHDEPQMADCAAKMAGPLQHKHPANNCCKDMGFACPMSSGSTAGLTQSASPILLSISVFRTIIPRDLSQNGILTRPALPPPISRI